MAYRCVVALVPNASLALSLSCGIGTKSQQVSTYHCAVASMPNLNCPISLYHGIGTKPPLSSIALLRRRFQNLPPSLRIAVLWPLGAETFPYAIVLWVCVCVFFTLNCSLRTSTCSTPSTRGSDIHDARVEVRA